MDLWFKIKIVGSYILLVALTVVTGWYVYTTLYPFVYETDDKRAELLTRSLLISNTVSALYQAEGEGTRFIQDPQPAYFDAYRAAVQKVEGLLDSLEGYSTRPAQKYVFGQIDSLLAYRDQNILEIAQQQQAISRSSMQQVQKKVERAIPAPALPEVKTALPPPEVVSNPIPTVAVREEIIYDTISTSVQAPQESFFQRLGKVFTSQPPQDTVVEIRQIRRTITDTLVRIIPGTPLPTASTYAMPRDTVIQSVIKVLDSEETKRQMRLKAMSAQLDKLILTDRAINHQINQLLEDLNQEWFATTVSMLDNRQGKLQKAGKSVLYVGATALLIILLSTLLIFSDLNKSRSNRRELIAARNKAEDLMKSREKLLLTVTHDIKAPLSSIMGYLDLLGQPQAAGQGDLQTYLGPMNRSAFYIMELLGNLLEYYRLEGQKTQLMPVVTPLHTLLEKCLDVFEAAARHKGVALRLVTEIDPMRCLQVDSLRLQQIINNLLSNAVKFTDSGFVELRAALEESPETPQATLHLEIYDTGCGIPEEQYGELFSEFVRVEQPRNRNKEGVGLGLSIVKRLVALFEGTITPGPNEHGGTTFTVILPVTLSDQLCAVPEHETEASTPAEETPGVAVSVPLPLRVLVVDDDPAQCYISKEMLRRQGHLALTAAGVKEALALLDTYVFDVVFTDIQMPHQDGFCLLEHIRSHPRPGVRTLKVIAVTANAAFQESDFLQKGFNCLLPKPFVSAQLAQLLAHLEKETPLASCANQFTITTLAEMVDGDLDALEQILHVFLQGTRESVALLDAACKGQDTARVRAVAHKMLPMFRQLQSPLAERLQALEQEAFSWEEVPAVIEGVRELLQIIEFHFVV